MFIVGSKQEEIFQTLKETGSLRHISPTLIRFSDSLELWELVQVTS